ncbi:MAG TPA: preprotein translocase subunit SecG [Candidatus Woesebacteria bacterium]|nr:preprotein translocase subunit SecG [Candidatus Woesebacteria bacterium]HNS94506.1 preprotein translocase subunit SecG [Candidatus Woesebacteria bacterium]
MHQVAAIATILLSVLIVTFILIQGRGAGLGSAWGGGGETFQTRRGVELIMMRLTVVFIVVFLGVSIAALLLK